ncbi:MAG TPA: hypothetical protein VN934_09015 [Candidatus Tumulicola sp.]|jgi:hypothetical protein|nr:hypothetical protein [Candidatus Tumulicola sp.]
MDIHLIEKILAFIGALVVGFFAVKSLIAEWPKINLEDHVTKVMMVLLTIGCIIVLLVAVNVWGRV